VLLLTCLYLASVLLLLLLLLLLLTCQMLLLQVWLPELGFRLQAYLSSHAGCC
jgi:hypothetical protein